MLSSLRGGFAENSNRSLYDVFTVRPHESRRVISPLRLACSRDRGRRVVGGYRIIRTHGRHRGTSVVEVRRREPISVVQNTRSDHARKKKRYFQFTRHNTSVLRVVCFFKIFDRNIVGYVASPRRFRLINTFVREHSVSTE